MLRSVRLHLSDRPSELTLRAQMIQGPGISEIVIVEISPGTFQAAEARLQVGTRFNGNRLAIQDKVTIAVGIE